MSPSSIRSTWKGLLTLVLLASVQPALAIDSICVQDANGLVAAFDAASIQYYPKRIMVSQGTYDLGDLQNFYFKLAPGTSIEGGYFNNCTQRQIGVGNTTVSATQTYGLSTYPMGDLLIEGLTFEIPGGVSSAPPNTPPGPAVRKSRSVATYSDSPVPWGSDWPSIPAPAAM